MKNPLRTRYVLSLCLSLVLASPGSKAQIQAVQAASNFCLRVVAQTDKLTERYPQPIFTALELAPAQGQVRSSLSDQWDGGGDWPDSELSPDRSAIAFRESTNGTWALIIRSLDSLDPQPGRVIHANYPADDLRSPLVWSTTGRWLAYTWHDETTVRLAVADMQMERQAITVTNSYDETFELAGFSFDDQYLATLVTNNATHVTTITLRSVPDLAPVNTVKVDLPTNGNWFVSRTWSPVSDSLAFTAKDQDGTALLLLAPSGAPQKIAELPGNLQSVFVGLDWSPHGRYITVSGHPSDATMDYVISFNLIRVQTREVFNVTSTFLEELGAGVSAPLPGWSPDGNHLFFPQYTEQNNPGGPIPGGPRDLMVYNLLTGQISTAMPGFVYGDTLKNVNWFWVARQDPKSMDERGESVPGISTETIWQVDVIDMRTAKSFRLVDRAPMGTQVTESPDGQTVVGWFSTPQQWGIRWLKDDGSGVHQLVLGTITGDQSPVGGNAFGDSRWSENSRFIAVPDGVVVNLVDIQTGTVKKVSVQADNWPGFRAFPSSDGKMLAVYFYSTYPRAGMLSLLSTETGQAITVEVKSDNLTGQIVWSPDDQWLGIEHYDSIGVIRPDGSVVLKAPYRLGQSELVWQPCPSTP